MGVRRNEHQCHFKSYPLILYVLAVLVLIKASLVYRFDEATILEATDMDCVVLYTIHLFVDQAASSLYLRVHSLFYVWP